MGHSFGQAGKRGSSANETGGDKARVHLFISPCLCSCSQQSEFRGECPNGNSPACSAEMNSLGTLCSGKKEGTGHKGIDFKFQQDRQVARGQLELFLGARLGLEREMSTEEGRSIP